VGTDTDQHRRCEPGEVFVGLLADSSDVVALDFDRFTSVGALRVSLGSTPLLCRFAGRFFVTGIWLVDVGSFT